MYVGALLILRGEKLEEVLKDYTGASEAVSACLVV